jgi:hypothetical protein
MILPIISRKARCRHLKSRLGPGKAIKAMARYLGCLIYRLMAKGQTWIDRGEAAFEQKRTERQLRSLQHKAKELGLQLVPVQA